MLTKMLCPTDFSSGAAQALQAAARLASENNAELVIVHSWYLPPAVYAVEAPFPASP